MNDQVKASLGIAALLAIGIGPGFVALALEPSRGIAVAAAGNAAMAVAFVVWMHRLVSDGYHLKLREAALRSDLTLLEERLANQARELREVKTRDAVTGVLNRTGFLLRLDETIARDARLGKSVGFLLVDIEGFKAMNAERGRIAGDALLWRVAHALEDATRGTDCVGRLGADEFGVVLNECADPGPVVERVFRTLQASAGGSAATDVHVAIGAVTIDNPAAGVEIQELFRLAEAALASVRGTGGSRCARRTLAPSQRRQAATVS
jgi:diguanylate cyclase (GGDEF)-like protein